MTIGTAGFTAALSIDAASAGASPPTRARSWSPGPLAALGPAPRVSCWPPSATRWWPAAGRPGRRVAPGRRRRRGDGRESRPARQALERQRWAAAVDCVGGATWLRSARRALRGRRGGQRCDRRRRPETSVMPFILRSVSLLGIDSVEVPRPSARRSGRASAGGSGHHRRARGRRDRPGLGAGGHRPDPRRPGPGRTLVAPAG